MDTPQNVPPAADTPTPADLFRTAAEQALAPDANPTDRARMITELLKAVDDAQPRLTETRRADVRKLREDLTLAKVSTAIGLSVARVDQIAKGK